MNTVNLTCIGCPLGCSLVVERENETVVKVSGNSCPNGEKYAVKEVTNPTRVLTGSVRVEGGVERMVSVRTVPDIPKADMLTAAALLKNLRVKAPVKLGEVLLYNLAGTGADVVATSSVPART